MGFFDSLVYFFTSKFVIVAILAVLLIAIIGRLTKIVPVRVFEVALGILMVLLLVTIGIAIYKAMNISSVTGVRSLWDIIH